MAKQIEKTKYYRAILNVLDVVETCPRNLRKALKENEYEQALAVLDYNSQWLYQSSIDDETKKRLMAAAKKADKRQQIREIITALVKNGKVATVEQILIRAGA